MSDQLTLRDLDTRIQGLETKIDKMSETFLTKEEFNRRADAFSTKHQLLSFKDEILKAIKDQADDYRNQMFSAMEYNLQSAKRDFGSTLENQDHKIKSLGEGIDMAREETMRLKLENMEEHAQFERKINNLILK